MKKIIIFLVMMIILSSFTLGALTDNLIFSWGFEADARDDSANPTLNWNGSLIATPTHFTNASAKLTGSYAFDGTGGASGSIDQIINTEFLTTKTNFTHTSGEGFSCSGWFYQQIPCSDPIQYTYATAFSVTGKVGDYEVFLLCSNTQDKLGAYMGGVYKTVSTTHSLNQWNMYTYVYTGTRLLIYDNITLVLNDTATWVTRQFPIQVGGGWGPQHGDGARIWIGQASCWNRSLSTTEVTTLYNGGSGVLYPFTTPAVNKSISITLNNPTDGATVGYNAVNFSYTPTAYGLITQNCSLYLNGILNQTDTSINNGTINYFNVSYLGEQTLYWNISCISNESGLYNSSVYSLNVDTTPPTFTTNLDGNNTYWTNVLNYSLTISELNIKNITIIGCSHWAYNTSQLVSYNKSINVINCSLGIKNANITVCDEANACVTHSPRWNNMGRLNVSGVSLLTGNQITTFGVYINSVFKGTTTGGFFYVNNLTAGSYNVTFDGLGAYEKLSTTQTISSTYTAIQFNVYTHNSINITVRDEFDNLIIDDALVTLDFIADGYNYTFTTTNGTLYADLLSPSSYTIRYYANQTYGGRVRHYIMRLTNQTHNGLNLYLISSATQNTTVTVFNQITLNELEGAIVYVQRRLNNNTYTTVAMYETSISGEAYFELEGKNEYYKFLVDYPWLDRKLVTDPLYIESTTINLYVNLAGTVGETFFKEQGIIYTLSFNDATQQFDVSWTDSESVASSFCLYNKKYVYYGKEIVGEQCSTASSGSMSVGGITENVTYYASFVATINSKERILATGWKDNIKDDLESGGFGLFMTAVIVIVFALLSAFHILAMIFAIFGLVLAKQLGLITIQWGVVFGVMGMSLVLGMLIEVVKR